MTLQTSWMQFFNENETRKEVIELLQPIRESIYNEIYIYLWVICFYSIMLFILILANLFMLLHILHSGKYIHNISVNID
jgi:membrane-anchored protein YejM (alkaline phosphatase superfamily)